MANGDFSSERWLAGETGPFPGACLEYPRPSEEVCISLRRNQSALAHPQGRHTTTAPAGGTPCSEGGQGLPKSGFILRTEAETWQEGHLRSARVSSFLRGPEHPAGPASPTP